MSKATENLYIIDFQRNQERLQEQLAQIARRYGKPVFRKTTTMPARLICPGVFFCPVNPANFYLQHR